jgi:arylsulfatase A-like enzyme
MRRNAPSTTRSFLVTLLACLPGLLAAGCGERRCAEDPPGQPSIVMVMIDTIRADAQSHHGYPRPTTPRLSAWAAEGTDFSLALAASPWTGPSVASVVTGRYPDELGIRDLDDPLPRAAVTLAEALGEGGWTTGAVVSNGYIAPWFGHDQGYAEFQFEEYTGEDDNFTPVATADRVTDMALEWLATAAAPYFLYVHYTDPHDPYLPPGEWRQRFVGDPGLLPDELLQRQAFTRTPLTTAQLDALRGMYDASIAFADFEIGRLLDALPDDVLVVVVGDHGEEFLEHGGLLHGHSVFEELLRVPLIFRGPGVCAGKQVGAPVSHVDIAPTLLDLAGLPPLDDPTGRSLRAELQLEQPRPEERVLFAVREYGGVKVVAARRGSLKLMLNEQTGAAALFDLLADPAERRNLAADRPDLLRQLVAAVEGRAGRIQAAPELDDDEAQRKRIQDLRKLGYIE